MAVSEYGTADEPVISDLDGAGDLGDPARET